jgi:probable F420-dependent oxidoreductase
MKVGIAMHTTDQNIPPDELAVACEERGIESLLFPDHSHIPTSRRTQWPGSITGEPLPEEYTRLIDPFVAMGAAAAVTKTLRIGTAVTLVAQRDALQLAKEVATVDWLSGGRVIFGVGFGWNAEEMANHGVPMADRWDIVAEKLEAMKLLWTQEKAAYAGRHVQFDESWAWPKPVQQPYPPILIGGGWGPRLLGAVVRHADGWMPVSGRASIQSRMDLLHAEARRQGRDPSSLSITIADANPDLDSMRSLASEGVERVLLSIPVLDRDETMRMLDAHGALATAAASA